MASYFAPMIKTFNIFIYVYIAVIIPDLIVVYISAALLTSDKAFDRWPNTCAYYLHNKPDKKVLVIVYYDYQSIDENVS